MKNRIAFCLLIFAFTISSCQPIDDSASAELTEEKENIDSLFGPQSVPIEECYQRISGRDTLFISMIIDGSEVTGRVFDNFYEKDDSRGTISGSFDTTSQLIYLWSHFISEGVSSYRQLIYRREGDSLVPGSGDEIHDGDSAYLKNPDTLEFNTEFKLTKIICPED